MQRFLRRFTWNDLTIRAKIGLIVLAMVVITGTWAAISAIILTSIGAQTREGVAATVVMRSNAQDMILEIEALQLIQSRIVDDVNEPGAPERRVVLSADYIEANEDITGDDIAILQGLINEVVEGESEQEAIENEFRALATAINGANDQFNRTLAVIAELDGAETGIPQLTTRGDTLEALMRDYNSADLNSQVSVVRSIERSLLETGSHEDYLELRQSVQALRIYYQQRQALNQDPLVQEAIDAYLEQVDVVSRLLVQLDLINRTAATNLSNALDSASRIRNIANLRADERVVEVEALTASVVRPLLIGVVIQIIALGMLMFIFERGISTSLHRLLDTTRRFEQGNFRARVNLTGQDEFSQLGRSFNTMAGQLAELVGGLEARVAERTRDLSITAEIGQAVLTSRDPRELMQDVVDLVRERFDFYHVQVFLVDDEDKNARLVASTGTVGRELLARRHSLPVGSQSVIGQVTATAMPVIALDTDTSAVHRRNELLPDTRSEMALPMRIGDQVIGALDVQSVAANAFDQDTVAVFQIMGDQLAIALENARLHTQLRALNEELENVERRMTARQWRTFQQSREADAPLGYEMHGEVLMARHGEMPAPVLEAIHEGRLIARENGDSDLQIAVPIRVRGEVIGAFGFGGEALRSLTEEDLALVEAVIDRVGLALENMRLVEQTARRAEYEQIVNEITAKIVGSTDINHILQTTVKELGRALRAPQTSVQLRREPLELRDEQ